MKQFADRAAAGRALAQLLGSYSGLTNVLVIGLPRGGVPVAFEVAQALRAPLDVMIVRKLGAPGQPEFAIGAVASGGVNVMNEKALTWFTDAQIDRVAAAERIELARRERVYRGKRPPLFAKGQVVILVDDGAATGATMLAAVRAVRRLDAQKVVVALPVASTDAYLMLLQEADEVVCVNTPPVFYAVGEWYSGFAQTTDEEVRTLLERSNDPARALGHSMSRQA